MISGTTESDEQNFAILGRHFFQAAYLTVDYDADTFTLAEANPTTDSNIVGLDAECPTPHANAPAPKKTIPNKTTTAPKPDSTATNKSLSTGAIVGAVIGGALVAAAIAGTTVFCFLRRRKRNNSLRNHESSMSLAPQDPNRSHGQLQEHDGYISMSLYPQEMGGQPDPREMNAETKPLELSNDKASETRHKRLLQGINSPVELG